MSFSPVAKRRRILTPSTSSEITVMTDSISLDKKALNKFSRQNAALGAETTAKLIKMKIAVFGLRGVGIETCKNLTLQGVGGITLIDPHTVVAKDIGVNFFFTPADIGKNRAEVCFPKLKELNPVCSLDIGTSLDTLDLAVYNAVVITQPLPIETLTALNERCRAVNTSFFYTFIGGLAADIFVDHGANHVVFDPTGEKPLQKLITAITPINDGTEVLIRYDTPEGQVAVSIDKGHYEVTEVEGIPGINHRTFPVIVNYSDPIKTLRVAYPLAEGESYVVGGLLTEKKQPQAHPMMSLSEKLRDAGSIWADPPTAVQTDYFGSELQQHVAFYATHVFYTRHGRFPGVRHTEDIASVKALALELLASKEIVIEDSDWAINEDYFNNYVGLSSVELQPMSAFAGGVLAQEVVKATGKFTPIPGWLHFASFESLPSAEQTPLPNTPAGAPRDDPRDELAAVYGWSFVEQLSNLRYFLVGSGALGCEFLKNFALNHICAGPQGKLYVTDADRIELSNLARQFLFREHNVGQPKSRAAAAMAKHMNPQLNVEALEMFVGPKTENVFHDDFWLTLDGVCNALDNIEARMYVDKQCVRYGKSLLESGTMGTNGNVDTIVPHKTRTYGEGGQAAEGMGVPMCTLRNFPHLPDHCIEWARDIFELLFVKLGKNLETYLDNPTLFVEKARDKAGSEAGASFFDLRALTSYAQLVANPSVGAAVQCAYDLFHFLFRDRILDLQNAFPKDYRIIDEKTGQDKGPFWNEKKRYPSVAVFEPSNADHVEFVRAATILLGVTAGIFPNKTDDVDGDEYLHEYRDEASSSWLLNIVEGLRVPAYVSAPVSTAGGDETLKAAAEANAAARATTEEELNQKFDTLAQALKEASEAVQKARGDAVFVAEPLGFEKDDDANMHIAFVTSCSNLRCFNYAIRAVDFHEVKVIAGKIIAAIATTTAAVCGLVIFELFKVLLGKDTDAYMNRNIGLGNNKYTFFSAEAPAVFTTKTLALAPDMSTLPPEGFDPTGKIRPEFFETVVRRAYPERHSVWDSLCVRGDLSIAEFAAWLLQEHQLVLDSWNFIYGYRTVADADSGAKETVGVTTKVYPPAPVLDTSLLPPLDVTLNQATQTLMRNPATRSNLQTYLALWKTTVANLNNNNDNDKDSSAASSSSSTSTLPPITAQTTLREVLQRMESLGNAGVASGHLESQTVSHLALRQFVVLPGKETPACLWAETRENVEFLAALKIML